MFLPKDIRCAVCSRIFCCVDCRKRHQHLEHVEKIHSNHLNLECPICNGLDAFILHKVNSNSEKLLEHIVIQHLPMQCKKCLRMFDNKSNFDNMNSVQCRIESPTKSKSTESPGPLLETIPEVEVNNNIVMLQNHDPLVVKKRLSVDSALSLRNVSSIIKINQSADVSADHTKSLGTKLVRTTSTPNQATFVIDLVSKHTPDSSAGGHVMMISSITQHTPGSQSSSGSEADSSHNSNNSSSFVMKKPSGPKNPRKILMAATPLQQVMSKSILRALEQHGIKSFNEMREHSSRSHSDSSIPSPRIEALDLRTTPVIRRSESQGHTTETKKNLIEGQRAPTKEMSGRITTIWPKHSTDLLSTYETCKTGTSIEDNFDSLTTPKNAQNQGAILKKTISFTKSSCENTPNVEKSLSLDDSERDIWFTPPTVLTRSQSCSILDEPRKEIDEYDNVFIDNPIQPIKKTSRLWSLVTKTVMRIKSFGDTIKKESSVSKYDNDDKDSHEPPFIKRRKITHLRQIYSIPSNDLENSNQTLNTAPLIESNEPRRRKIHCRPAIARMRKK